MPYQILNGETPHEVIPIHPPYTCNSQSVSLSKHFTKLPPAPSHALFPSSLYGGFGDKTHFIQSLFLAIKCPIILILDIWVSFQGTYQRIP
jgi:hypothetical protein